MCCIADTARKDMDLFKQIQSRSMETVREMEHFSCEARLGEVGIFSLEKRRLWDDFTGT